MNPISALFLARFLLAVVCLGLTATAVCAQKLEVDLTGTVTTTDGVFDSSVFPGSIVTESVVIDLNAPEEEHYTPPVEGLYQQGADATVKIGDYPAFSKPGQIYVYVYSDYSNIYNYFGPAMYGYEFDTSFFPAQDGVSNLNGYSALFGSSSALSSQGSLASIKDFPVSDFDIDTAVFSGKPEW